MIKKKTETNQEIVIDLTGPEGNAFYLLGMASNFGKQLKMSDDEIRELLSDMRSSNYEHLVEVFDRHFGSFVTLLTD